MKLLAVGLAGSLGAFFRYTLGLAVQGWWNGTFPLGTMLVNFIGCALLGWFTAWAGESEQMPDWLRVGFGVGLIGSFTTFSTFSVETIELIRQGRIETAVAYVLLSMWGGLLCAWLGGLRRGRSS